MGKTLADLLHGLEKASWIDKYEKVFFKEDPDISKLKAIVGELYITLEQWLNLTISSILIDLSNKKIVSLFENEILDKMNISRKITILDKSGEFDPKVLKKIRKINDLRNSLLHFKTTTPLYGNRDVLKDKTTINQVVKDYFEITDHLGDYWKKKGLLQPNKTLQLTAHKSGRG